MSKIQTTKEDIKKYWGPGISGMKLYRDYCKSQVRNFHKKNDMDLPENQKRYLIFLDKYKESREIFSETFKEEKVKNPNIVNSKFLMQDNPLKDVRELYENRMEDDDYIDTDDLPEVDNPYFDAENKVKKKIYYYD